MVPPIYVSKKNRRAAAFLPQKKWRKSSNLFLLMFDVQAFIDNASIKTYISHQDLHQVLKPKKWHLTGHRYCILVTSNQAYPIPPLPSRFFTSGYKFRTIPSTVYCAATGAGVRCWDIMNFVTLLLCKAKINKEKFCLSK